VESGNYGVINPEIKHVQKLNHERESNRVRYMPQKSHLIGSKVTNGEIHIFDLKNHPVEPNNRNIIPDLKLVGQKEEGYGIEWNSNAEGEVLSASFDHTVALWDISGNSSKKELSAKTIFQGHNGQVEDVSWKVDDANVFASVGDDQLLIIWDKRAGIKPVNSVIAHTEDANCVSFHPFLHHLLASGSNDRTIALWDLRNLKNKLHNLDEHADKVIQVAWSPSNELILASTSSDCKVNIWDVSKIGSEILDNDTDDPAPELLFSHGGHCAPVSDFSWNLLEPWLIGSVDEDNSLQIWKMADNIINTDYEVDKRELEPEI